MKNRARQQQIIKSGRLYLVLMVFVCAFAGLVYRAVDLQVFQRDFLVRQAELRNIRNIPLFANRGIIQDRYGVPLAVSTPVKSVWINPKALVEEQSHWKSLAQVLGIPEQELSEKILANLDKEFLYLKRHLPPHVAEQVVSLGIKGVHGITEYKRFYPAGEVAAQLVGLTDIDDVGQEGMELAFENKLKAQAGARQVVKDLLGRVIKDVGLVKVPEAGESVALSIDLRAQYQAYKALAEAMSKFSAAAGSVVALDVKTGEILAIANLPSANPNDRSSLNSRALRNRAITDVFEPGSTAKPFTVAAALEAGTITQTTPIDVRPGTLRVGNKTIRDHRNYGVITAETLLTKSSNVGAAKLALAMEPSYLPEFLKRIGFGEPVMTGFPGESIGFLPLRSSWHEIERATLSYGYGFSVNLIQLAQAYGVIAAGGKKLHATLLQNKKEAEQGEQVMNPAIARQVVHMLESVATDQGTARLARIPGYRIAGKTGTVHKLTSHGYADDKYLSLFVGMAPVSDPRFVVAVIVDDPRSEQYYGGQVAAPVFSEVMKDLLRLYGIRPDAPVREEVSWTG